MQVAAREGNGGFMRTTWAPEHIRPHLPQLPIDLLFTPLAQIERAFRAVKKPVVVHDRQLAGATFCVPHVFIWLIKERHERMLGAAHNTRHDTSAKLGEFARSTEAKGAKGAVCETATNRRVAVAARDNHWCLFLFKDFVRRQGFLERKGGMPFWAL